jgi:tetratricopeptide (TPR) repeat protein
MRKQIFIWLFLAGLMLQSAASVSLAQEKTLSATMQKGIGQFKHENYDEALVTFQLACKEEPNSSFNSYYLGLTYKKLQDYKAAIEPLKAAVTNEPKIGQALIELIDCLYQLNELDEAKTWIAEAEKEFVHPAQAAFLKGLVLLKADDNDGAIKAFTDAKTLDKGMEQSCDYQIGIAYMKKKQFVDAKKIFKDTIVLIPLPISAVSPGNTWMPWPEERSWPSLLNSILASPGNTTIM